jgi:hypothetical protein
MSTFNEAPLGCATEFTKWQFVKRIKSLYLGKDIALAIQSQPDLVKTIEERVLQAINTDNLENLKAELRAKQNQY